jgi:hypothetical protein
MNEIKVGQARMEYGETEGWRESVRCERLGDESERARDEVEWVKARK